MSKPLVFFGSGPLAAATLEAVAKELNIGVVITKPAPEHGHKTTPPVIKYAEENDLELYTPANKAELSDLISKKNLPSYCGLVVDYGLIIPQDVIDYFEHGIINSHFSLLPLWRGADPITFPLLNGDETTGVTLMKIVLKMDAGDMLAQSEIDIEKDETAQSLTDKLVEMSNNMLIEVLPEYLAGKVQPIPQPDGATYSRKLTKEDGLIDWSKSADELEREVRAFSIWPKSYSKIIDLEVVITKADVSNEEGTAGEVYVTNEKELAVYCGEGSLIINKLKVAGKAEMTGQAFINGYLKNRS